MPVMGRSLGAARLASLLLALCLLSACGISIDADQVRVCRSTLPALNPGAVITVERVREGPAPRSLRVDYVAQHPDRPTLERYAVCQ